MRQELNNLSREQLQEIIMEMTNFLTEEQLHGLEAIITKCEAESPDSDKVPTAVRMSQELVDEKMEQLEDWMKQIDEGELYLDTDEYEDYSDGYWDREWVVDYYDNQEIGAKIESVIQFAKDCVDDRRYQEAGFIYEWLWNMFVSTDEEGYSECVDLEKLSEEKIIHTDMQQLALLTLYADYQAQKPEKRAEHMYLYFIHYPFKSLHVEDILHVGRENLTGTGQFWKDWIALLKTKNGCVAGRLLQEAVLYSEGVEGLVKAADENCQVHPSLYLSAISEYDRVHDYAKMEELGKKAMDKIDRELTIRSEIALKAAYASSCLMHKEDVMLLCWESFQSDSTVRNFLRLFGMEEMAERYGMRGGETLRARIKGNPERCMDNTELHRNIMGDEEYYTLSFYTGDFQTAKQASKNPQGSLGWSTKFIRRGIRLFLLYLYEEPLPSKAAAYIASAVGFPDDKDFQYAISFENEIAEESRKYKTSIFWNYFKRWKQYFPMMEEEKKKYLAWVERLIHGRTEAIVGGQHRRQYGEVASLLAMLAEIKSDMGEQGAKWAVFAEYKRKFPRHSSFQAEMKGYFGV